MVEALPWATHPDPLNALSIPTWIVHFSSVFEFLFAMTLVWRYAAVTGNDKWKGLAWGMVPLYASGIAACTDHFFYNDPRLQGVVTTQVRRFVCEEGDTLSVRQMQSDCLLYIVGLF